MILTISGTVNLHREDNYEIVSDVAVASLFDGVRYTSERMSDYLGDGTEQKPLAKIGLKGGAIELRFDASDNRLWVDTSYTSPRELSEDELASLVDYTRGQWSDGMGENMEIEIADERGLLVELYSKNQEVRIETGL